MVFGMSASAFVGMTYYAITTKNDLTQFGASLCYGALWGLLFLIPITIIFSMLISNPFMWYLWATIGSVLACLFVAIDTQMILSQGKYGVTQDDYIVAALILYIDFIRLLVELLRLFGTRKN